MVRKTGRVIRAGAQWLPCATALRSTILSRHSHSLESVFNVSVKQPARNFSSHELKKPSDSFINVVYPFRSSKGLRDQYVNHYGDIRVGKILESMDALAAAAFFKHLGLDW